MTTPYCSIVTVWLQLNAAQSICRGFRAGFFAAAVVGASATDATAQTNAESHLRALVERCGDLHGVSVATRDCLRAEDKRYGALLEGLYRQALVQAGPQAPQVREAQRAWIKSFQAECALLKARAQASNPNPVFAEIAQMGCELKWTLDRIDALEKLVR